MYSKHTHAHIYTHLQIPKSSAVQRTEKEKLALGMNEEPIPESVATKELEACQKTYLTACNVATKKVGKLADGLR